MRGSAIPFGPRLIVVSDAGGLGARYLLRRWEAIAQASSPGSVALQLRDHQLGARQRLALGRALRAIGSRAGQSLIVNDTLDLCLELRAQAVHLGGHSLEPSEVTRLWCSLGLPRPWIACAMHPPEVFPEGCNACLVSPVMASRKGRPALGATGFAACIAQAPTGMQIYALGGVTAQTAPACMAQGAAGVAVMGAALDPSADYLGLVHSLGIAR